MRKCIGCIVFMIGLFGVNILTDPITVAPPEEITVVKRKEFIEVPNTNDDIEAIQNIRNIYGYNNTIYWTYYNGVGNVFVYSSPSINGSTTQESTSSPAFTGGNFNVITRGWGNVIYSGFLGTWDVPNKLRVYNVYSTDGGLNWNEGTLNTVIGINGRMIDVFKSGSDVYSLFSGGSVSVGIVKNITTVSYLAGGAGDIDAIYPGTVDSDGDYIFIIYDGADFKKIKYDVGLATYSTVETLAGLVVPSAWDVNTQQYWKFGNIEVLMDVDHFYVRENGGTWVSFSDVGTTTNGIIWGLDKDGNLVPLFIIWKDSIYAMNPQGTPSKMQVFTDDAFVGWLDWICNGVDKIYQTEWVVEMV